MKRIILIIPIIFLFNCSSSEYELVGEIHLTDGFLKYFPNYIGNNFLLISNENDTIKFIEDELILEDDQRWEDESHFQYYIYDSKILTYRSLDSNFVIKYSLTPDFNISKFRYTIIIENFKNKEEEKSNIFVVDPIYEEFDSIKNNLEYAGTMELFDKEFNDVLKMRTYQELYEYNYCHPDYDTCVEEIYFAPNYGILKLIFNNNLSYSLFTE